MNSTSDWLHFHQSNPSTTADETAPPYTTPVAADLFFSGRASDPMTVSTSIMSSMTGPPPVGQAQLSSDSARASKPARKRTRASRRTPTTLINTDATNFRAMVQQFTGGPSTNYDFQGPGPQVYTPGYGLQLPMGQSHQPALGPLQYSISSSNNNNDNNSNIMFMQRAMGIDRSDINVNVRVNGSGCGSSSSENRSNNSFQY